MSEEVLRLLFLGDVVGRPGRKALAQILPQLKGEYQIDFCLANGENAAGGLGLTPEVAEELLAAGVNFLTTGNHIWDKREIYPFLETSPHIIRPANYPPGAPGRGWAVVETIKGPLGIINLSGRVFMDTLDCPFRLIDRILEEVRLQANMIVVDFHAEATAEKIAMGRYLDGRVSAVIGTHTHVQTADEKIFPGGTAYLTDVGMCGPRDSILGVEIPLVLERFLTQLPNRFAVAKGPVEVCGVVLEISPSSGRALSLQRINLLVT